MSNPAQPTSPQAFPAQRPTTTAEPLNVLLVGAGGREHALALKLCSSPRMGTLFATDLSNPGIAALAKPLDIPFDLKDPFRLQRWCINNRISLAVIGPEEPLCAGLADILGADTKGGGGGLGGAVPYVFGPSKEAAQLEGDKAFAKDVMRAGKVPTAESRTFTDHQAARRYLESRTEPHVIKAAGLAKGKGVIVPATQAQALEALDYIMLKRPFGAASDKVVIEEKLKGKEVSVLALCDGRTIYVLEPCQDHKRLSDGAKGPNTGGMGALCPTPAITDKLLDTVQRDILVPTIDALKRDGIDYKGVLYAGIMLTPGGPKVLEFNCRFGDPEAQALLARWDSDLLTDLVACADRRLDTVELKWKPGASVCLVIAAPGYPDAPVKNLTIEGLDEAAATEGVTIIHAGTARTSDHKLVTAGGRVLNVVATGDIPEHARQRAYAAAKKIRLPGMILRSDIGTDVIG
jgi:phosphoribosylamine--glycine ligase